SGARNGSYGKSACFFYQDLLEIAHYVSVRISSLKRDLTPKHNSEGYRGVVCELVTSTRYS
ncbi:TPA: hypothetical protein ACNR31_004806, partial [Escherichia coli]